MRVLIIMGGFFPGKKYGGPPVSVDNFCTLMKGHNCYILTHNHDMGEIAPYEGISDGWHDRTNCKVMYLSNKDYNKTTFKRIIKDLRPDILYLQGLFQSCILPCLKLAKRYCIPILLAPRGELCAGALNLKRYRKLLYIKYIYFRGLTNDINWQSTSEEETKAIKLLMKVDNNHIYRLNNIPCRQSFASR